MSHFAAVICGAVQFSVNTVIGNIVKVVGKWLQGLNANVETSRDAKNASLNMPAQTVMTCMMKTEITLLQKKV